MYLIDANIILEVLYKRKHWRESREFLNAVKRGSIGAYILHFTLHGISAILGRPDIVSRFLTEILSWRGLLIADLSIDEELAAAEIAEKVGLDFDDGLHYYFARKMRIPIVSYDRDFDKTDVQRLEPAQIKAS
ncbi:MAG: PIN domain nuclease [Thermoprotei archaeon]|nr:MAG: PIN domain nuclease [Thermoprotei archaeon]